MSYSLDDTISGIGEIRRRYGEWFSENGLSVDEFIESYMSITTYHKIIKRQKVQRSDIGQLIYDYNQNVELLINKVDGILKRLKEYGVRGKSSFFYDNQFFSPGEYYILEKLFKSKFRETAEVIKSRYKGEHLIYFATENKGCTDISEKVQQMIGVRLSNKIIVMVLSVVITELFNSVSKEDLRDIIHNIKASFGEIGVKQKVDYEDLMDILNRISGETLYYVFNTDFSDSSLFTDNKKLFSSIVGNMEKYKMSVSRYQKMSLLNVNDIDEVDKDTLILVEIVRRALISALTQYE